MANSQTTKINISGTQVIKTLQLLLEDNFTMSELIQKLNENEEEPIFNNNVISKYINTCRYCGFEIYKIYNKYTVTKIPFGLNFSIKELELIDNLQKFASEKLSNKQNNLFNSFITKLNKYSNKNIIKVKNNNFESINEFFEKALQQKRRIQLILKAKYVIECIPIEIIDFKNKKCFKVFHKNKERIIAINRVSQLELLGKRISFEEYPGETVIFRITGNLAKRYNLREHEQEISRNLPEYITISNVGENKKDLLSRLLRYDKDCEILSPKSYRDEIKNILNNMLANYGE